MTPTLVKFPFRTPTESAIQANAAAELPPPIKRATVELELAFLTVDDVRELLESGDPLVTDAITSACNNLIVMAAREQVDELPNYEEVDLNRIDYEKLKFTTIANTPKESRRGGGLPPELVDAFKEDFQLVLTAAGSSKRAVDTVLNLVFDGMKNVKNDRKVLNKLTEYLDIWKHNTQESNLEVFAPVTTHITKRINGYLVSLDKDTIADLGI